MSMPDTKSPKWIGPAAFTPEAFAKRNCTGCSTPRELEEMRERAETAEAALNSITGKTRAALVAAAVAEEREACAKLFDGRPDHDEVDAWAASVIRNRGTP